MRVSREVMEGVREGVECGSDSEVNVEPHPELTYCRRESGWNDGDLDITLQRSARGSPHHHLTTPPSPSPPQPLQLNPLRINNFLGASPSRGKHTHVIYEKA